MAGSERAAGQISKWIVPVLGFVASVALGFLTAYLSLRENKVSVGIDLTRDVALFRTSDLENARDSFTHHRDDFNEFTETNKELGSAYQISITSLIGDANNLFALLKAEGYVATDESNSLKKLLECFSATPDPVKRVSSCPSTEEDGYYISAANRSLALIEISSPLLNAMAKCWLALRQDSIEAVVNGKKFEQQVCATGSA